MCEACVVFCPKSASCTAFSFPAAEPHACSSSQWENLFIDDDWCSLKQPFHTLLLFSVCFDFKPMPTVHAYLHSVSVNTKLHSCLMQDLSSADSKPQPGFLHLDKGRPASSTPHSNGNIESPEQLSKPGFPGETLHKKRYTFKEKSHGCSVRFCLVTVKHI